jgi:hypothetical protein
MVKHASKLNLKWDIEHKKYNTPKGKLEESFHLGKHCTWIDLKGPLSGAYPVEGLGAPGASSSHAPSPTQSFRQLPKEGSSHFRGAPKKTKGKLDFLAQGLFACFNIGRQNAKECEKHMKWQAQEFHKAETERKAIMTKLDTVRELKTFDPPSPFDNPWDNLASWVEEEDDEATKIEG